MTPRDRAVSIVRDFAFPTFALSTVEAILKDPGVSGQTARAMVAAVERGIIEDRKFELATKAPS